jgi:hypothetical protein
MGTSPGVKTREGVCGSGTSRPCGCPRHRNGLCGSEMLIIRQNGLPARLAARMPWAVESAVRRASLGCRPARRRGRSRGRVPGVGRVGGRMGHFAADAGEVAGRFHQIGQHGIARDRGPDRNLRRGCCAGSGRTTSRCEKACSCRPAHGRGGSRRPSLASRSMWGVVPASLQPKAPTESALMSSVVMMRMLVRAASAVAVNTKSAKTELQAMFK